MQRRRLCLVAAVLSLSSLAGAQTPVAPASVPASVPAVEVVATRIPESPHDVPASIEVVSGSDLRARGAQTLGDALALSAGVSIASGGDGGPASAVPEFWGLREFDAFLLVVDGIPWGGAFNPALTSLSLRDVERIEVLRGAAPVTYGATSFVGVIHVVHNADAESARYLSATGGSFGSGSVAADLGVPLIAGWKSRVSVDLERDGFRDDRTGYQRGHALWRSSKVADDRRSWFTADLNVLRQDPASPHAREGASLSSATPLDANYNPAGAFLDDDRIALGAGFERLVFGGATWGTTASFTRSSQRRFRGFLTVLRDTADNASGYREDIGVNDLYADTHLIWPRRNGVRFMTGADLLFGGGEAKGAAFSYTAPLAATSAVAVAEPTTFNLDAGSDRLFAGLYGSAEWQASARLALSGGLRMNATRESRGESDAVTHSRLSGSVGALFNVWERGLDHVRFFANVRDTFKPAAFDFSLAENEGVLEPETSRSYEAGVKVRTREGMLDLEASAFRMDFTNLVTATVVGGLPALVNAGQTRFQGVELGAGLHLATALTARATVSAHDGKFVDFVQDFDGTPTQLAGKRFEMSARRLWSAGLTYAPEQGFIATTNVNHTGDRYMNKRNSALAPAFTSVDAGAGYRTGRYEFRVDARNLGDRRDVVSESEFGDAQYYRMPARSVRAGIVVRY